VTKVRPPVAVAAAVVEVPAPVPLARDEAIEFRKTWKGFGVAKCAYLAPEGDFVGSDGAVDVVVHFNAGQMSQEELRASGLRGVFVSCGYGIGTGGYSRAFEDPRRFAWMLKRLMAAIASEEKRPGAHVGRLALAAWSAGFASVNRILAVPSYYAATDAVVLLDGLHAQYVAPNSHAPAQGKERVDRNMLRHFIRFAADAAAGKKTMVVTHSAIVPPDYASTAESTAALLDAVGVTASSRRAAEGEGVRVPVRARVRVGASVPEDHDVANGWDSDATTIADQGGLHVRGFRGAGPRDHFDHLHLIGDALRSWLVPRWYTPGGERR
jgi:hypothetical protein